MGVTMFSPDKDDISKIYESQVEVYDILTETRRRLVALAEEREISRPSVLAASWMLNYAMGSFLMGCAQEKVLEVVDTSFEGHMNPESGDGVRAGLTMPEALEQIYEDKDKFMSHVEKVIARMHMAKRKTETVN